MYTLADIAETLGVSPTVLRCAVRRNKDAPSPLSDDLGRTVKLNSGAFYYDKKAVIAWWNTLPKKELLS
jgi:hypothetical protein